MELNQNITKQLDKLQAADLSRILHQAEQSLLLSLLRGSMQCIVKTQHSLQAQVLLLQPEKIRY